LLAGKPAPTAEALMRSRYTAYARGNLDYVGQTCAGEAAIAFNREEAARSVSGTEWVGLTIEAKEAGGEGDDAGAVTFTARYRQSDRVFALSETSQFRRIMGAWRYVKGDVAFRTQKPAIMPVGRNDPCPCGSGKKYKKCHGAG
jgi:SEC-C motif-containing protein